MQSKAKTVAEYMKELPEDRRKAIQIVWKVMKKNMPRGYKEGVGYGMIGWEVPLSTYPKGYGGNPKVPLPYVGLASQKNYMSLYLMCVYGNKKTDDWFRKEYKKTGKKLDMGKGCVRFKKLDDLPLELVGRTVALTPVKKFIEIYEKARGK